MSPRTRRRSPLGTLLAVAGLALAVSVGVAVVHALGVDVGALATRAPERTALMRQRQREAERSHRPYREQHRWVPYERISPNLRGAVLVAEDDAFFSHSGLDWDEIRESARRNWEAGRVVRGGSTITQQLAKNLWLGTSRSPLRKIEEVIIAVRLEHALGKRRIFELYLNSIEWGDGVYGAEAAARRWFGRSASSLSPEQGVRLAAVIINPRRYSPVEPSRRIDRRIRMITSRLRRRGQFPSPPRPPAPAVPAPARPTPDSGTGGGAPPDSSG